MLVVVSSSWQRAIRCQHRTGPIYRTRIAGPGFKENALPQGKHHGRVFHTSLLPATPQAFAFLSFDLQKPVAERALGAKHLGCRR